ncbi:M1 family metallopeptidase [soil metagenome]
MRYIFLLIAFPFVTKAQDGYWQQRIKYVMDVNLDVQTNLLKGKQTITYTNNSPDALKKIFIHLYWNAFQPNSMMDVSSRSTENIILGKDRNGRPVSDYDRRFKKRINELTPEETGRCHITKLLYNGKLQKMTEHETILEVDLDVPVQPRSTVIFNTEFNCQVPKLSRRSGRDSDEKIRYSMGQWYPKISEYDKQGWHPDDYISREFYGVWGDYDVNITLDKNYKVGATGILTNAASIGWGYDREGTPLKDINGNLRTWKFSGKNIHDFVWGADPEFIHFSRQTQGGPLLHFIFKGDSTTAKWKVIADTCVVIYPYMAKTFGPYPYPVYSFIQGGGGGTEYPMATLMKNASMGTAIHEWCHSWYQMMLGTNENLYAWMDEGFADYAEAKIYAWLHKKNFFEGAEEYERYFNLVKSGYDEPMSTHANFFETNTAYNTNAYYKGAIYLRQLGYVVGEKAMEKILSDYYKNWRYKHPDANDFIRIAEKVSGMQLQWYNNYMINSTKVVDYGIDSLWEEGGVSKIRIKRNGEMPMPVEVELTFRDSSKELHYLPLNLTLAGKVPETSVKTITHAEWKFTHPFYTFEFSRRLSELKRIEIDPTKRLADIEKRNDVLELNW